MKILVFSTVYPNERQPNLGVFIRERMSRVGRLCDIKVVAPVPWFPFAGLVKKKYKLHPALIELQDGVEVYHPRFFLIPGFFKWLDGFFLCLSSILPIMRIRRDFNFNLIDGHFAYPDGLAAVLLGRIFNVPVTITLRGTINKLIHFRGRGPLLKWAIKRADRVFSVSRYLVDLAIEHMGEDHSNIFKVIPNGVDSTKFVRLDRKTSRRQLNLPQDRPILISVGGLVDRKGHHRVLEVMPELIKKVPQLLYLIVGGGTVEGNNKDKLLRLIGSANISEHVRMVGEIPHSEVNKYLSAADIFVLPTQFEGWPNAFLEAMSCGLPVVTTDVCGNKEIVSHGKNGLLVPYDNNQALLSALIKAYETDWDRAEIVAFAYSRPWNLVAQEVYSEFQDILNKDNL